MDTITYLLYVHWVSTHMLSYDIFETEVPYKIPSKLPPNAKFPYVYPSVTELRLQQTVEITVIR